jgi:hypothetical protein
MLAHITHARAHRPHIYVHQKKETCSAAATLKCTTAAMKCIEQIEHVDKYVYEKALLEMADMVIYLTSGPHLFIGI